MPNDDYRPLKGHCFLIPSGTSFHPGRQHLFVLVTNACPAHSFLAVSLSSIKRGISHDPTCTVEAGEHPFLQVDSYVVYAKPQQLFRPGLTKCITGRIYTQKENCEAEVLERIRDGVMESPIYSAVGKAIF
jgi:hypothetical protein